MPDPITPREFDLLRDMIADGFEGVHSRLDKVNGRLDRHDDAIHETRETLIDLKARSVKTHGRANRGVQFGALGAIASVLKVLYDFFLATHPK